MITRTKFAIAALLMIGIASAAQAGSRDDADSAGGSGIGPLGQTLRGPAGEAFGYVPRTGGTLRDGGLCWEMTANGHYVWAACPQ